MPGGQAGGRGGLIFKVFPRNDNAKQAFVPCARFGTDSNITVCISMKMDLPDRKIFSLRRPVNCFHGTHSKNLITDKHRWTRIKTKFILGSRRKKIIEAARPQPGL